MNKLLKKVKNKQRMGAALGPKIRKWMKYGPKNRKMENKMGPEDEL